MFIAIDTVEKFFETFAKIFALAALVSYLWFGLTAIGDFAVCFILSSVGLFVSLSAQIIIRRYY